MNMLIPYEGRIVGHETIPTVDGRDLHSFLGSSRDYTSWVKAQINRAHLRAELDYTVYTKVGENPQGGRPSLEYAFTFDAAKMIGMMANSAKGLEIRQYFLACERDLHNQSGAMHQQIAPDMQAIIDLAISVDKTRKEVEAANQKADEANAMARLALNGQQWLTIRQYVSVFNLIRQVPPRVQQDFGRYLSGLCLSRGIPTYLQRCIEGWQETTYPMTIIQETLGPWLNRYGSQGNLHVVGE